MFAVKFDDYKRRLAKNNIKVTKLITAMQNTDDYNTYMGLFLMPENKAIDIIVEDDNSTYTFFTLEVLPIYGWPNPDSNPELKPQTELLTVRKDKP